MVIIENIDINLEDTIECGQCFRYTKEKDNSYTIVIIDRVVNIKQVDDKLFVNSNDETNLKNIITNYLDLNTDYNELNISLLKSDIVLKKYIDSSIGLKMLRQDPFEMVVSYIISARNSVPSISKSVNSIASSYGKKVIFNNKKYYLFPKVKDLINIKSEELNKHKLGYRDKFILDAINKIYTKQVNLNTINNLTTEEALEYLKTIKGIGPKVSSCVLLFGYHRFDVYPIDTWVIKTIEEDFNQIDTSVKAITEFTKEKFGKNSGLAIQYMFHTSRNKEAKNGKNNVQQTTR